MLLLISSPAWSFPAIENQQNQLDDQLDDLDEDSFSDNPKYRYSFNVFDDDEQVYQDQSQQMEDRVRHLN
jgi:hypothetical protein